MDLLSVPVTNKGNRKERELQKIKKRLETMADHPGNRNCADCPEGDPTFASLLALPVEGGKPIAVLCCAQCRTLHAQLDGQVCLVKSIRAVNQCKCLLLQVQVGLTRMLNANPVSQHQGRKKKWKPWNDRRAISK